MQMMADIRMLQEQNQQLQVTLAAMAEAIRAINGRFDEQAAATRKGFADQGLKIDQFGSELRVVREGVSETGVRLGQLSQEIEALRSVGKPVRYRSQCGGASDAFHAATSWGRCVAAAHVRNHPR
jgi:hypothetical protein